MLGKLLKHEFIATGRMYVPVFIGTLILTPLLALLIRFSDIGEESNIFNMFLALSIFGYIMMLLAVFISSLIFVIIRFYKSMTTEEAYLTFTLPVKTSNVILSKLIPAVVCMVLSFVIFLISIFLFTLIMGALTPHTFSDFWRGFTEAYPYMEDYSSTFISMILVTILSALVALASLVLQVYVSIAIGQLMNSHRLLTSIGVFIALFFVIQLLTTIISIPIQNDYMRDVMFINESGNYDRFADVMFSNYFFSSFVGIAENIVIGAGLYIPTWYIFKKKLNLE